MERRDAIAFLLSVGVLQNSLVNALEHAGERKKVVIVGGGTGGLIAYALLKAYAPSLHITLVAPNAKHLYQSGVSYVAAGVMEPDEMIKGMWQFVDEKEWVQEKVKHFSPEENLLHTQSGQTLHYDYLIVALGVEPDYSAIEGMDISLLGHRGITSIYHNDTTAAAIPGALMTRSWYEAICKQAQQKQTHILFANAKGHIKCGGAILSALYMLDDALHGNGPLCRKNVAKNVEITYAKPGKRLFGLPRYNKPLMERSKAYGNITHRFSHSLVAIDSRRKRATFEYVTKVKDVYDPDFEEWSYKTVRKDVEIPYDFLHVTPPMHPPKCLQESVLAKRSGTQVGFAEVDRETLQHKRFANVFAVGDCAGIPLGKTAIAAKCQAKTAVENTLSLLTKEPMRHYDGYSGCPIKLGYNDVLFAEFDYEGALSRIIKLPCIPKHSLWEYDRYRLPQLYWSWLHGEKV